MYAFIRRIHLFASLILLVFVLMYFVTGYAMIHETWFGHPEPKTTRTSQPLSYAGPANDAALADYLQSTFQLRGKPTEPKHRKDGSVQITYNRPGTVIDAVVSSDQKSVQITKKEGRLYLVLNSMHRLRGYGGGFVYDLWAALYDLASLALILFACTGVYLWFQSTRRRLPGLICLVLSFGYTAATIAYFMLEK